MGCVPGELPWHLASSSWLSCVLQPLQVGVGQVLFLQSAAACVSLVPEQFP